MGAYSGPSARSTRMWVLIVVLQLGVPVCGCL